MRFKIKILSKYPLIRDLLPATESELILQQNVYYSATKAVQRRISLKGLRNLSKLSRFWRSSEKTGFSQKTKVAKIHNQIKNSRLDFLHKLSTELVKKYNAIAIEDLNMKGMSQALNFGKSVSDNGWGMFTTMLKYKTELSGKQLIKIDKYFPSSQLCSCCGQVNPATKNLNYRWFTCDCGNSIDRDLNASINIKEFGANSLAY